MTLQLLHTPYTYCILKIRLSAKYKLENSNLINRTTSLKVTEIPVSWAIQKQIVRLNGHMQLVEKFIFKIFINTLYYMKLDIYFAYYKNN